MKIIKFGKDYPKLDEDIFTSIRMDDKDLKLHDLVTIQTPTSETTVEVVGMEYCRLEQLSLHELTKDTGVYFGTSIGLWEKILHELRKYYPKLRWDSMIYFYKFSKGD